MLDVTRFEIQSYIYHSLHLEGFNVRGGLRVEVGDSQVHLDVVIFQNGKPSTVFMISSAADAVSHRTKDIRNHSNEEKAQKYATLMQCDVYLISTLKQASDLISFFRTNCKFPQGAYLPVSKVTKNDNTQTRAGKLKARAANNPKRN